jgi:hypothetical protein
MLTIVSFCWELDEPWEEFYWRVVSVANRKFAEFDNFSALVL